MSVYIMIVNEMHKANLNTDHVVILKHDRSARLAVSLRSMAVVSALCPAALCRVPINPHVLSNVHTSLLCHLNLISTVYVAHG